MCVIKRTRVKRSYHPQQNPHMFRRLGLSKSSNHEELLVKGHEKGSMMGVNKKHVLLVRGHKEKWMKVSPISEKH
jgi:hypothetical protein